MRPLISVIIPTYNRDELLERAVSSVLEQTFGDFEVIVVDGARRRETLERIRAFGDGRVRYLPQKGRGIADARNTGVKNARGKLIAFLDDDDVWKPEKLEIQLDELNRLPDSYGLVYTAFNYFYLPKGLVVGTKRPSARGNVYNNLLLDNITGTSTILVKRECFKRAGLFRESFTTCEDWDMWLRIAKHCMFGAIDEPLVDYSIHPGQFSFSKYLVGRYKMIEAHSDIRNNPTILSYHLLQIGVLKLISGDKSGSKDILRAFCLNPFLKKTWRPVVMSVFDPRTRIYIMKFLGRI